MTMQVAWVVWDPLLLLGWRRYQSYTFVFLAAQPTESVEQSQCGCQVVIRLHASLPCSVTLAALQTSLHCGRRSRWVLSGLSCMLVALCKMPLSPSKA